MKKAVIYARVSTSQQELEQQVETCKKFCEIKKWDYDVFTEKQSTRKERPVFNEVLNLCKNGMYSYLVVFRIDRGWRSSRAFILDFDCLVNRDIYCVSVMEGFDPTTPIGKAMMTIFVALGELERENISIATKQRLASLKALGKHLGRPVGSKDRPGHKRPTAGYKLREELKRQKKKKRPNKGGVKN